MRVALVHELLTMRGGAERVARIFAEMFPEAPIYTLLYDEAKLGDWFPKARVRTSILQPTGHWSLGHSFNHHRYLRRFPAAVEAWDFSQFDLVLSSSSAFAHGIITNSAPKHLSYIHSPARYLWDRTHDVLERAGSGGLGPLKRAYLERTFHRLRTWDAEVAPRADKLIAASAEVQRRIELYWRRPSLLMHPPIDDFWFVESSKQTSKPANYYLVVSTLARYKRIDLAIAACNQLGVHLKIVGEGPDRARLQRLAGPSIKFYGERQGNELRDLYTDAKAVLFPGAEDFGLVPVEAMACGTPVVAYRGGGALETVVEGETGLFFDEPSAESLASILGPFDRAPFDADACRARAARHTRPQFEKKILECIEKML